MIKMIEFFSNEKLTKNGLLILRAILTLFMLFESYKGEMLATTVLLLMLLIQSEFNYFFLKGLFNRSKSDKKRDD